MMRIAGFIVVLAGILMLIFKGFGFTKEKKVVDVGPVEVNAKEHHSVQWPAYAGVIAVAGGIVMIVAGKKKS